MRNMAYSMILLLFASGILTSIACEAESRDADRYLSSDPPTVQTTVQTQYVQTPTVQTQDVSGTVLRFGKTWIFQDAPDLQPVKTLQQNNDAPLVKIRPKKSWELKDNNLGVNTSGMPRSRVNDYQPTEPVHLIDGNVQSCWVSRGKRRPEMEPAWVRLDFPVEQTIEAVVLKKRPHGYERKPWTKLPIPNCAEVGQAMPQAVRIESSRDNLNWTVLYEGPTHDTADKSAFESKFVPTAAKSVRVFAQTPVNTENYGYAFSIAELEVFDTSGRNVALVSNGTGIIASSTEQGRNEIDMMRTLWPAHGDAGFKWVRIGYHDDPVNWHEVEKVKGVFEVDKMSDESITELANMGLNIIMCLDFGNRLYTMPEEAGQPRPFPQLWEWYYDSPKPPTTPEALTAWDRYVEFMVVKYRDRVKYFEVWNEWNISLYWGGEVNVEQYLALAKRTIPIIRRLAPEAKILVGSTSGFPFGCANWSAEEWLRQQKQENRIRAFAELVPLVDVLSWHPYYQPDVESEQYLRYPDDVRAIQKWARQLGFTGRFMNTEWNMSYNYPEFLEIDKSRTWRGSVSATEMQKAKYTAQAYVQDAGLGMVSLFCELNNPFYGALDLSLFRRSADSDPLTTLQPEAAYYAVRNLATQTEGFQPDASWSVQAQSCSEENSKRPLRIYTFQTTDGQKAAAIWYAGKAVDVADPTVTNLVLPFAARSVIAMDPLNGVRQELKIEVRDGQTTIPGAMITDVPLILRAER